MQTKNLYEWNSHHLRNMLNRKALLWKKWRISTHIQDKLVHKEYSTKCKNALTLYMQNKELDVIFCGNIGKFYWYANNKLGSRRTVQPLNACTNNSELTHNPLEQANLFNKYFSSVFTVDNASKPVIQPSFITSETKHLLRPWRYAPRPAEETCLLSL